MQITAFQTGSATVVQVGAVQVAIRVSATPPEPSATHLLTNVSSFQNAVIVSIDSSSIFVPECASQ